MNEIFVLLNCYVAYVGFFYRRFGTAYPFHFQGSRYSSSTCDENRATIQKNEDRHYTVGKLKNLALAVNVSERVLSGVFETGLSSEQKCDVEKYVTNNFLEFGRQEIPLR